MASPQEIGLIEVAIAVNLIHAFKDHMGIDLGLQHRMVILTYQSIRHEAKV